MPMRAVSGSAARRKRGDDINPSPHRALGIFLVCTGIAKIGQYSVAAQFSNEAVITPYDAVEIDIDHRAHVLRIEPDR